MKRAIILVMDSFGVGATPDAKDFGDVGADTLRHIAQACAEGNADRPGMRSGPLTLPNLCELGLANLALEVGGSAPDGLTPVDAPRALFGAARERSLGKDTPSGHWEMAGLPVEFEWGYFGQGENAFPQELVDALIERANLPGILGNCAASGTEIIAKLGDEHIKSGKPICYTSADSVFQIAAHEEHFGLERLYEVCKIARELVDDYNIGRVIARPFVGDSSETYARTGNRKDLATPPHAPTLLDVLKEEGGEVIAIGKIGDIFAHSGTTREVKANGNDQIFTTTLAELKQAPDRSLLFSNFVDFDMLFGHRRDTIGYAKALEDFDARMPEFEAELQDGDLVIITADHGCDPTLPGSDHTREHVPVICFGPSIEGGSIGIRASFADMGQTIADHLDLPALAFGESFLPKVMV